jgi:hypothetical protein
MCKKGEIFMGLSGFSLIKNIHKELILASGRQKSDEMRNAIKVKGWKFF